MKKNINEVSPPKSFRVRAENVPVSGLRVVETLSDSFVNSLLAENERKVSWKSRENTVFDCSIEHEAEMLRLVGGGDFKLSFPCVRCMEELNFTIEIEFNTRLLPRTLDPDLGRADLEVEAYDDSQSMKDDMVVSYFEDGIVDLTSILREQLFLELPEYPTCDSVDSGLGRQCDLSMLESINAASQHVIEHPFSKLKNWKPSIRN